MFTLRASDRVYLCETWGYYIIMYDKTNELHPETKDHRSCFGPDRQEWNERKVHSLSISWASRGVTGMWLVAKVEEEVKVKDMDENKAESITESEEL